MSCFCWPRGLPAPPVPAGRLRLGWPKLPSVIFFELTDGYVLKRTGLLGLSAVFVGCSKTLGLTIFANTERSRIWSTYPVNGHENWKSDVRWWWTNAGTKPRCSLNYSLCKGRPTRRQFTCLSSKANSTAWAGEWASLSARFDNKFRLSINSTIVKRRDRPVPELHGSTSTTTDASARWLRCTVYATSFTPRSADFLRMRRARNCEHDKMAHEPAVVEECDSV